MSIFPSWLNVRHKDACLNRRSPLDTAPPGQKLGLITAAEAGATEPAASNTRDNKSPWIFHDFLSLRLFRIWWPLHKSHGGFVPRSPQRWEAGPSGRMFVHTYDGEGQVFGHDRGKLQLKQKIQLV